MANLPALDKVRPHDKSEGVDIKATEKKIANPYANWEKWSNTRWAWEFLKRNKDFRRRCDQLAEGGASEGEEAEIAVEFGLEEFKSYRSRFRRGAQGGLPRFTAAKVAMHVVTDDEKSVEIVIQEHEAAFVVDLRQGAETDSAIAAQIHNVKIRLTNEVRDYRRRRRINGAKVRLDRTADEYLHFLHILDLQLAGYKRAQIALKLYPEKCLPEDPDTWAEQVKGVFEDAIAVTRPKGYLKLAVLTKKISMSRANQKAKNL